MARNPPVQERSRRKQEKMLEALESLLTSQLFEEVSVATIARKAGVAIGTLYQRFPTKEAMLPILFERHNQAVEGLMRGLHETLCTEKRLQCRLQFLVRFAVDYHRRYRGLLRALTAYVRGKPEVVPLSVQKARLRQYRRMAELVVGDGSEMPSRNQTDQALFALGLLNAMCREQLLFPDATPLGRHRPSQVSLERNLVKTLYCFLTAEVPPHPRSEP